MNPAEMSWTMLTAEMHAQRLRAMKGEEGSDCRTPDVWSEATRRVRLIARKGFRRTIPLSDLEDVEQAVMMKLLDINILRRAAGSNAPGVYIAQMIRNAAIDHLRKLTHDLAPDRERFDENLADIVLNHELDRGHRDDLDRLALALEALSRSDRWLLAQRFWSGLSIAEIAASVNLPYSTVAKRLFRAAVRLRSHMDASNA